MGQNFQLGLKTNAIISATGNWLQYFFLSRKLELREKKKFDNNVKAFFSEKGYANNLINLNILVDFFFVRWNALVEWFVLGIVRSKHSKTVVEAFKKSFSFKTLWFNRLGFL